MNQLVNGVYLDFISAFCAKICKMAEPGKVNCTLALFYLGREHFL